jgi:hypothetical protein
MELYSIYMLVFIGKNIVFHNIPTRDLAYTRFLVAKTGHSYNFFFANDVEQTNRLF